MTPVLGQFDLSDRPNISQHLASHCVLDCFTVPLTLAQHDKTFSKKLPVHKVLFGLAAPPIMVGP